MMMTDNVALDSCCATSAHTPNPANAIAIPMMLDGIIAPMLLKKSFLNIMLRAIYAYWLELKTPINNVRVNTLMMGMSSSLL